MNLAIFLNSGKLRRRTEATAYQNNRVPSVHVLLFCNCGLFVSLIAADFGYRWSKKLLYHTLFLHQIEWLTVSGRTWSSASWLALSHSVALNAYSAALFLCTQKRALSSSIFSSTRRMARVQYGIRQPL